MATKGNTSRRSSRTRATAPAAPAAPEPIQAAPEPGGDQAPAPSADQLADVGAMIGEAVGSSTATTDAAIAALDALAPARSDDRDDDEGSGALGDSPRPGRDYSAEYARRKNGTPGKRGPGRPRKDAGEVLTAPVLGDANAKPGSKAAIAAELEETRRELERMRATTDTGAVDRLGQSVQVLAVLLFSIPVPIRGPHWALKPEEAKNIGDTFGHALAPYADQVESQLPWVAPTIALLAAVGSRVLIDLDNKKRAEGTPIA